MKQLRQMIIAVGFLFSFVGFAQIPSSQIPESMSHPDGPHPSPNPHRPIRPPGNWSYSGISLQYLGFWYTGRGCFYVGQPPIVPGHVLPIMQRGARMVLTTAGYRLMVPYDPIFLTRYNHRNQIDDMITSTPYGVEIYSRYAYLPEGYVEIFQRPPEAGPCRY